MRTDAYNKLKRAFEVQSDRHQELGSYINLCYVVIGRNYNKEVLRKAFNKLVNKDEYDSSEKNEYISYLSTI